MADPQSWEDAWDEPPAEPESTPQSRGNGQTEAFEGEEVERPRYSLLSLASNAIKEDTVPEAIVENLIYRGLLTSVNAANKTGKSYFNLQMAMCAAEGQPFLGLETQKCRRILLFSLELPAALVDQRCMAMARDVGLTYPDWDHGPISLFAPTRKHGPVSLDLRVPESREVFEALIDAERPELVLMDTVSKAVIDGLESKDEAWAEVYGFLATLANRYNVAIVVYDHTAKGYGKGEHEAGPADVSTSAIGTQYKGARSAVILAITRKTFEGGGVWELQATGWVPTIEQPITYMRPRLPGGELHGEGLVVTTASASRGFDADDLKELFVTCAPERDEFGRPMVPSGRSLHDRAMAAGTPGAGKGDSARQAFLAAVLSDFSCPGTLGGDRFHEAQIITRDGPRNATQFIWKGTTSNN